MKSKSKAVADPKGQIGDTLQSLTAVHATDRPLVFAVMHLLCVASPSYPKERRSPQEIDRSIRICRESLKDNKFTNKLSRKVLEMANECVALAETEAS